VIYIGGVGSGTLMDIYIYMNGALRLWKVREMLVGFW
jgi:hypothetical protein